MGDAEQQNMSRFTFVLVATLLAFAVSESTPETELEESYSPEQAHAEAQQSIDALLQEGKKDSACRNLATGTKKEITDGQRNTQRLVNRMDVGKNCHTAGLAAYNAAKSRETSARNQYHSANNACNRAKGARVQVGAKSLSQFKVGCAAFLNDGKYIAAKRHMTNTCNNAIRKKAAYDNSRKATASALKAHQKAKVACACRAQKNYKAAVKATSNFNSVANAKAWTKAHHMMCVLDGKPANKCAVPRVPRVTAPRMPTWVARTRGCSSSSPSPPPYRSPCPASYPHALEWKNSGKYWCYKRSDGNKSGGGVCHYTGSTRAPRGKKWGTNQVACPIGCYKDKQSRDLPVYKGSGKSESTCKALCKGYPYYALQWKGECRCGKRFGKYGKGTGCKCGTNQVGAWLNCVYKAKSSPSPPKRKPSPSPPK